MVRVIAVLSLLLCLFALPALAQMEAPGKLELSENWKLAAAKDVEAGGAAISQSDYREQAWHPIHRMPATILQIMQEDGVYPNLYVGMNMLEKVPQDLYKQDWWYRHGVHRTGWLLHLHPGIPGHQLPGGNLD